MIGIGSYFESMGKLYSMLRLFIFVHEQWVYQRFRAFDNFNHFNGGKEE